MTPRTLLALGLLAAAAPAAALDIYKTKHNFYGAEKTHPTTPEEKNDLCQICHVPNRITIGSRVPALWEKKSGAPYQNAALDVRADPAGPPLALRWAGSTLRCLSCHDGTISSINIVFRPASVSLMSDKTAGDQHRNKQRDVDPAPTPQFVSSNAMGNHPVSIPYPMLLGQSKYRGFGARSNPLGKDWNADPREKGLKLVSDRSGFDVNPGSAGIECASCHDPHGTGNAYFLRISKSNSQLCLACHKK
jgi:predicted CXXCH cytochrome family protein